MNAAGGSLIASALPLVVLLAGCASSTPQANTVDQGHVIIGQGSPDDRQEIESSNQQMMQIEQAGVSSPAANVTAPAASQPTTP